MEQEARRLQAMHLGSPIDESNHHYTGRSSAGPTARQSVPTGHAGNSPQTTQAMLKSAFEEVRQFAGGLVSHPYESTKHYSILRHSHGLVYYSGPFTNLAITIFSDRELPPDRTLWLQRKGWTGKAGLKVGALLGSKSAWVDVTPTNQAMPDQVKPTDERAWQRDIKKFLDKAPKEIRSHKARQTCVLRIPSEADDGYLRVVLCAGDGKKVLCPSPVFRLASTSASGSSIKGASLSTLPLEIGVKIASVVANNTVTNTLSPVIDTAKTYATDQIAQVYHPGFIAQEAMTAAYDSSGVPDRIDNANQQFDNTRDMSYQALEHSTYDALARPDIVGDDSGPRSPFPVRFHGRVVAGTGRSKALLNMPTANLANVPEDILLKYKGVFFGWAAVSSPKQQEAGEDISDAWYEAVITIAPQADARKTVLEKNMVRVYLVHDFGSSQFSGAKLSVMLMGFLRPADHVDLGPDEDTDSLLFDFYKDVAVTTASLARPAWKADVTLANIKSAQSSRSLTERYVDLRQSGQKQLDRVPLHKLGVRTESDILKDRLVGNGGIWIPR